ncbi:putative RNA-directed DNA polymerase from transposon BS [Caerostris darwini]|uniref:RNA-directed DNA polymerase from transposon BS n=1 Tax=Caerostris darwini TaxID=1538125 RepID=A0AAV4WYZ6_9ARAC|nr:putative RNA-directed DNA polymerase from transposon BS [Caerostris darwini]
MEEYIHVKIDSAKIKSSTFAISEKKLLRKKANRNYNTTDALDLTISSPDLFPYCSRKVVDYVGSDHYPILIELDYDIKTYGNNNLYWNFKKANWTLFEKNLNEQLQKNPITEDLENEWFLFKHSIFTAAEGAVPRGKHKETRPAFTNDSQDLQKLLAKRELLLQSHNLNDNTDARIELNKINAEIKREYCSIKQSNWQDLCKSLDYKTPNTRLWRLAKKLDKIQPQVENTNSIIGINGTSTVNDKETADALGNYYSEESKLALGRENKKTGRATRKLIRSCRVPASNELFNIPITSSELLYAIQQLDFKKSLGPDVPLGKKQFLKCPIFLRVLSYVILSIVHGELDPFFKVIINPLKAPGPLRKEAIFQMSNLFDIPEQQDIFYRPWRIRAFFRGDNKSLISINIQKSERKMKAVEEFLLTSYL